MFGRKFVALKQGFDDVLMRNVGDIWRFIAVVVACEKLRILQGPKSPGQIELRQKNKKMKK